MAEDSKSPEPADTTLIEQVGVARIADALAISKAAVRKWRKTGIPENRRQAILALVNTEQATAEQLSLVDVDTSTPESNDDDRHIESVSEAETSEEIDEAQAVEGSRRPRQRENAHPSISAFQTQRQPTPAGNNSRTQSPSAQTASRIAMQQRKPVRLNR